MNAEILCVGTELLLGNIVNTNARDLAITLSELGINVYWQTVVGDNPGRLKEAVAIARSRADIIITTGGLGPTCDDLTKQTLAEAFGKTLYFDKRAEAELKEYFCTGYRPMTANNLQQCWLPEGCVPFYNTCGTAPGCGFTTPDGKAVLMLPGPPKEMNAMMRHGGIDFLRGLSDEGIYSHNIHIFGMGESAVETLLRDRMNALTNPTLAPYAKEGEVRLRVTAKAKSEAEAEALMAPVIGEVRELLGDAVYGIDSESLEKTVLGLLNARGNKIFAAAESCTGGLIAKRFTDLPGASAVFRGGVTVYTNAAKTALLGVDEKVLAEKTAVSRAVAAQLAENVRKALGADYGVGVTGLAGPEGDGVHEVGDVFVSLASAERETVVRELHLGRRADRVRVRTLAANHAFDLLRRSILGLSME